MEDYPQPVLRLFGGLQVKGCAVFKELLLLLG